MLEVRSGLHPFVKVKMDQKPGEDVRLKRVDVHADSNRPPGANPVDQNHSEIFCLSTCRSPKKNVAINGYCFKG